ncbi:hypothetical protein T439DRAFT_377977 [Meredithblackwellia eburnea MCA 4105]
MASIRTQTSYLSPAQPGPSTARRKLRKEERDKGGLVLPTNSGTGYGQTNGKGKVVNGADVSGNGADRHHLIAPRLQAAAQHVKDRRHAARQGDDLRTRGTIVDEDGVVHDSEYVQFRTATPVHMHRQESEYPNDDDSASSSSSSESGDSAFPSSPYTYQSTHRTTTSTHHYSNQLGSTASAIPGYLQSKPHRSSVEYSSSLTVPRAPSPRRTSADYDNTRLGGSSGGIGAGKSKKSSSKNGTSNGYQQQQFTTSSYQPPAPAFGTLHSGVGDYSTSLRLPTKAPISNDSGSLTDSINTLSIQDNASGSGYNQFASTRPPKLDGSALDAGVHGMKRSWDGFKLEMKFGARGVGRKFERKLRNL